MGWPPWWRRGPAAVLLDDLQWSDDATLEFLAALAGHVARAAAARRRGVSLRRAVAFSPAAAAAARPAARARARRGRRRGAHGRGNRGARRGPARGPTVRAAGHDPARPHRWHSVLRGGAHRGAAGRRPACGPAPTGVELDLDGDVPLPQTLRDAVLAAHRVAVSRPRARPRRRPRQPGPGSTSASSPASAVEDGLAELVADGPAGRADAGAGRVSPPARARCHLRGHALAAAAHAAPLAGRRR